MGSLPWLNINNPTEFGMKPTAQQLLKLSKEIKTFTEGTDPDSSAILSIRNLMNETARLIFLGFAFHKLNMKLLKPTESEYKKFQNRYCFATAYDVSESDQHVITGQIKSLLPGIMIRMSNLSCVDFFKEYWRSLSF